MKSESVISKEIQDFLTSMGVEWFWRNQVYKGRVKSGAYLHTGKPGISDLIIVDWGYTIYIEVKDATGKQKPDQRAFQLHCDKNNQPYWLVRSIDDLKAQLNKLGITYHPH